MCVKCAVSPCPVGVWIVSFGYMIWQHCFFPFCKRLFHSLLLFCLNALKLFEDLWFKSQGFQQVDKELLLLQQQRIQLHWGTQFPLSHS